jgi:hypothetical protein
MGTQVTVCPFIRDGNRNAQTSLLPSERPASESCSLFRRLLVALAVEIPNFLSLLRR